MLREKAAAIQNRLNRQKKIFRTAGRGLEYKNPWRILKETPRIFYDDSPFFPDAGRGW